MRLLGVELLRLRSMRSIVFLVLLAAMLAGVLAAVTAWDTRPLTQNDRAEASAQAALESQRPQLRKEVEACEADPAAYLGPEATGIDCEEALVPSAEAYYPRQALSLGRVLGNEGLHLALVIVGIMLVAGSVFGGADWASGAMTNQLLFQPRRASVWAAKAAALGITSAAVAVVVLGAFWLVLWGTAEARAIDVSQASLSRLGWHLLRAALLTVAAAVGGFALTMIFRHTRVTLALLFVYAVGGEIVTNIIPVEGAGRLAIGNNVFGWLARDHHYFDATIDCAPGEHCDPMQVMTHLEAGTFLGGLLVLAVATSVVVFNRRDI